MKSSKFYHGTTFLNEEDLRESKTNNRVELEYYRTNESENNIIKEDTDKYGIEIVKKEYKRRKINIESNSINNISDNSSKVIEIIETLKRHKVTPIGLHDVVNDLIKKQ